MSQGQNPTPEERKRIVDDIMGQTFAKNITPEMRLMEKWSMIDARVKRIVSDEWHAKGYIGDKKALQEKIGEAYYEELKRLDEGEIRSLFSSFLTLEATRDL
jgi:hypothetical protein